jgi:hypothetical protein
MLTRGAINIKKMNYKGKNNKRKRKNTKNE